MCVSVYATTFTEHNINILQFMYTVKPLTVNEQDIDNRL